MTAAPEPPVPTQPDRLMRLWTPHRMAYVQGENRPTKDSDLCPFCEIPSRGDDVDALIVRRSEHAFAVLNLYPYNPGHLLICPYRHVADYTDLTDSETDDVAALTQQAMRAVRAASSPDGFNLGMNQGHTAGAGVAAHLHQHVVPRWSGDANFMPIIGQTKTIPQLLEQTRALIAQAWPDEKE